MVNTRRCIAYVLSALERCRGERAVIASQSRLGGAVTFPATRSARGAGVDTPTLLAGWHAGVTDVA